MSPMAEYGAVVAVHPFVRRILANNPGPMTGPGTNTYLIGRDELLVVDPGPVDQSHLDAVVGAIDRPVRAILVTHHHLDHAPGAAALSERVGAEVLGYDEIEGFRPDRRLGDGDDAGGGAGWSVSALHTPGHASDHLCYLLDADEGGRLLFSGDHVMDGSTVVIHPPDGDMREYLEGLHRLLELSPPAAAIAPGHGAIIDDPKERLTEYIDHRMAREAAIYEALARAGSTTVEQIVEVVYVDVPKAMYPIARFSVWAHLRKLSDDGRAVSEDYHRLDATWRVA